MRKHFAVSFLLLAIAVVSYHHAGAQDWIEAATPMQSSVQPAAPASSAVPQSKPEENLNASTPAGQNDIPIAAGTRVLTVLVSPLHSTSGTEGSGVYLETVMPVIEGNRVVIPAHTLVEGTVEGNRRPGHFNRSSEFQFRFSSMIFPNNAVTAIHGVLQSIPGSKTTRASKDGELHTVDQTEKALIPTAGGAAAGAIVGSVSRFGVGKFVGGGLGAGLGLSSVLLQRGDEINLPQGTHIEIVLRNEVKLTAEQANFNASYVVQPRTVVPAAPVAVQPERRQRRRGDSDILWPLLGGLLLR